jgi:uncharacterized membrane protein
MGPQWERISEPPPAAAPLFMDAVLTPHRSLSLKAFRAMLIGVIAVNLAVGGYFIAQGAFPVAGFLGLDVLVLWWAFRVNYRAARTVEQVQVAREHVHVSRRDPKGRVSRWIVNPSWTRVSLDGAGVLIRAGKQAVRVAAFLSPPERAEFAQALDRALWRAKRGF